MENYLGRCGLDTLEVPFPQALDIVLERGSSIDEALAAAEAGLSDDGAVVSFDAALAQAAGLGDIDVTAVQECVSLLNEKLGAGELTLDPGWASIVSNTASIWAGPAWSTTINGVEYKMEFSVHWWGVRVHINKALLNKLCEFMAAGAAISAIIAWMEANSIILAPKAAVMTVIALLLAAGAAVLKALDFCNGINIDKKWWEALPIPKPA